MTNCILIRVDLSEVKLLDVDLQGAKLNCATFNEKTRIAGKGLNLKDADIDNIIFKDKKGREFKGDEAINKIVRFNPEIIEKIKETKTLKNMNDQRINEILLLE